MSAPRRPARPPASRPATGATPAPPTTDDLAVTDDARPVTGGAAGGEVEDTALDTAPATGEITPGITARARVTARPTTSGRVLAQAEERFAERRRSARWRLVGKIAAWIAALAVLAALVWLLFFSTILTLHADKITVDGAGPYVDPAAVSEIVATAQGIQLARIDAGTLKDQIVQLPGVLDARIDRSWPNGMVVHITPRQPVVASEVEGGVQLWDADAVPIAIVETGPDGVPTMGLPAQPDADTIAAALTILSAVTGHLDITGIDAAAADLVTISVGDTEVVWGDASNNELKIAVVQALLAAAPDTRSIDVSNPDAPITH